MAKKSKKTVIGLRCTESGEVNYSYFKPNNLKEKLKIKKYSKKLKKHTIHEEVKHS